MSDIEVPNIDFDTETSLTTGPAHDDILGTAGNDLVFGSVDGAFTTLNPADIIRGGDGGEDMLSITFTGDYPQAVGFLTRDMDVFQVRNFAFDDGDPGEAYVNMIDVLGTSTLWLDQPTGDTFFDNVQNLTDVVFTGGGFQGDTIGTHINFAPTVAGGTDDTLELLLSGTMVDFEVNDYDGANGVENLWLQADGVPSDLEFEITGLNSVMVTGNAASVYLEQENWNDNGSGDEYLATFDSTGFAGMVEADLYVGNGSGTATVDTLHGADDLYLDGHSSSTLDINVRGGNDTVDAMYANRVELLLGNGNDTAYIGTNGQIGSGGVDVNSGKGTDELHINTSGSAFVRTGDGTDTLELNWVGGNADVKTGWGHDSVTNIGGVNGFLTIDLGLGNDTLSTYAGGGASVIAATGDDNITITDSNGDVTVKAGSGNNTMNVRITDAWYDDGTFLAGDDVDNVTFYGYGHLNATLRGGNDVVNANRVDQQMWLSLGEGDDLLDLSYSSGSYGYLNSYDTVMGEGGNDTIRAYDIDNLRNGNSFANTTSVERVQFEYNDSSSFYGDSTGANAAGVMTYDFLSNNSTSTYLYQLADGVTLNMRDNSGLYYFRLDLDDSGGATTANLNFSNSTGGTGSTGFYTMNLTDVGTLNVNVTDAWGDIWTNTTVLGSGSSFIADSDLTTVNLAGSTHIHMADVAASGLSLIDGSTMSTNIFLDTDDVSDSGIAIKTGSGNDTVQRDDAFSNYDIETNGGNDTVRGVGGDDNVKLGSGTDLVQFTNASDLDTFDTVDGGSGTDTLQILNGGLTGNDDFFFLISEVENWILSGSADTLSLGNIAQSSGMQSIDLGTNRGATSGSDSITLQASYSNPLTVFLGWGTGSDDTVDAGASAATLTVKARSLDLNDGGDTITGGTGLLDELQIFDVNTYTTNLNNMTAVEKVSVTVWDSSNIGFYLDGDDNVAAGETLTISTRTDWSSQGDLDVYGSGELDGMLVVTGGWGNDRIFAGEMADTVTTNQGNDYVEANGGNDTVSGGGGSDTVWGGDGDDSIDGGTENDYLYGEDGTDDINAGTGSDWIDGGAGGDTIDVGVDANVDTLDYNDQSDSFGGSVDQVSNFGSADKIDLSDVSFTGLVPPSLAYVGQQFVGNGTSFGNAQGLVTAFDGIVDVVFQADDQVLWVDVNDDGTLNNDDLQIHLVGVTGLHDDGLGGSTNLVLDAIPA